MTRHTERRSLIDPARLARDQVRAGLPVTVCPFCGGDQTGPVPKPGSPMTVLPGARCCCISCWTRRDKAVGRMCAECPHASGPQGGTTP